MTRAILHVIASCHRPFPSAPMKIRHINDMCDKKNRKRRVYRGTHRYTHPHTAFFPRFHVIMSFFPQVLPAQEVADDIKFVTSRKENGQ